ncbi:peptidoglycan DD-metalloendopeptidase family protein [Legionella jamestowniensis]|uniref:M23/M37 family transporter peptidase n=1 Tax=Legionella jamestowniensis TaxID=455 RepID=A0A0W0UH76_9GAMM|nr:peptidoglycan DD-metalloendopeptidase family protein [Legionella jamestowniensis]KTD07178.1 M23/M37 family transporter peptidase [Legionella jamestowniensis]OCH98035.1 peptidase M24 [Legionella jamestowniensis]SFL96231.1 Murein DD-endopeptidase MepM and murein hydrolase activator NlpD, contain LysM domain [Legionella jamestowniensis DSM 19215]
MDQQPNVSSQNANKPSKLMALLALVIAFALPFVLVKLFPHKHRAHYSDSPKSLADIEDKPIPPIPPSPVPQEERNPSSSAGDTMLTVINKVSGAVPKKVTRIEKKKPIPAEPSAKPPVTTANTQPSDRIIQTNGWKIIKAQRGDSLAVIFKRVGLSSQTLQTIIHDNPRTKAFSQIKPDQQVEFLIQKQILEKMIMPVSSTQNLEVYREGHHYKSKLNFKKMDSRNRIVTATVRGSLASTAKRYNIPYKLVQQMTEIFTWDINFAKEIRAGDQFTIIYQGLYVGNKLVDAGEILAVSYRNRGRTFQAVRHTDRSGHTDYYSPQGASLKKAFDRYPLRFSHISSTFSLSRYHPILHYRRAHKGVDLAAPIGTPIRATGDGRIEIIGRQSGYGNMIKISHNKTYSTIYGHMLKFQKGISRGTYVKRGQVIGYVGQTGLASGPHCHYEFHINRQPRNPTTVDLPRGFPISGREMASFRAKSAPLLAQLKSAETEQLAKR